MGCPPVQLGAGLGMNHLVQALRRRGWLPLSPLVLTCLHPLAVAVTKRRCFHVVFKSEVLGSFGAEPTAMLLPCHSCRTASQRGEASVKCCLPAPWREHPEGVMGQ